MELYFKDQRYTSNGEPELGVGKVTETSQGRVKLFYPSANETRLYAIENAPLRRIKFKAGDTITDINKRTLLIERIEQVNNLYVYSDREISISEAHLGDISVSHGVEEKLFVGDVDSPQQFALRRETLEHDYRRKISPVNGFVGGRIDLIPHQLYIAHEVSSRYAPRVMLSDQVGLGKTIEACLILHRLLLSGRISRVIILVPESLIHQWFVEVLRRFNLWFNIYNEERCRALDDNAPEGNPFLDDQLILCSTDFLAGSEKRAQQALSASWDMLVVDEAHHLEWSIDKVSPQYNLVDQLSKVAKGLLLLSATPEQLGVESHFARLRLLDPNRYTNYENFISESGDYKKTAVIAEKIIIGKSLTTTDKKNLATIFSVEKISSLVKGGDLAKNNLIEDLLDQYGPGRVIFRNTRSALKGFPQRKAYPTPIQVDENQSLWIERLTNEFHMDMDIASGTKNKRKFWFDEDPRVEWLLTMMTELYPAKVLLICKSKDKVLALEEALAKMTNLKVGVFHEDLTILQRDRNAAWFSESNGARLLLCSEIGSEGRNFQIAHHLILFDLPLHPELLEQRIGRLDRIGQSENIHVHIPYLADSPQHILVRWFHEGLNAFEENYEGGNQISKLFGEELLNICRFNTIENNDKKLNTLIANTTAFQKELKINLENGRNKLLEMNSFRPKRAEELVHLIQKEDSDESLENYMINVFEHFDVEIEDLAPRTYLLYPDPKNTGLFQSIPQEGLSITFDRKRALSREDISFISWEHPMATSAIDLILSSGTGSASYGILRGGNSPALLMEFLFIIETSGSQSIYVDRFLPNTPIRIVIDHTGKEVTDIYSVDLFDKKLTPGQIEELLDNDAIMDTLLPKMISKAKEIAETRGITEKSNGLKRMNHTLNHEIDRLKMLQKRNKDIRPEEIQIAMNEQATLAMQIKDAHVRMDAILLIRKE